LTYEIAQGGRGQLREITIERGSLLNLLEQLTCPCINRHQDREDATERKTFSYPFTELLSYRGVLKLVADKSGTPDDELRIFFDQPVASELSDDVRALLSVFKESSIPWITELERRGVRQGVVSFDDLPALFAPGMPLLATDKSFADQVAEVFSSEIVVTSATSEAYVVEAWYFRWDGSTFSRTSYRFQVDRYRGKRPIRWLPFQPLLELGREDSTLKLDSLLGRNQKNLEALKGFLAKVEPGDYPLCVWGSQAFATLVSYPGQISS
jgi:hypothetical protein